MTGPVRKILTRVGLSAACVIAACGIYLGALRLSGNFHEVLPGELYRSAQPSGDDITDYVQRYGIKTVINLRGESKAPWYREEVEAASQHGLTHIDFRMSATKHLPVERMLELEQIMRNAPKPILIHCQAGADRSGLASVLYMRRIAKAEESIAERQLWPIIYGHVAIPHVNASYAMDESWQAFVKAQKASDVAITAPVDRSAPAPAKAHGND